MVNDTRVFSRSLGERRGARRRCVRRRCLQVALTMPSCRPVGVMNLLASPTGHLSNLPGGAGG